MNFKPKQTGDTISAREWNALTKSAHDANNPPPGGYSLGSGAGSFNFAPFQQRLFEVVDIEDDSDSSHSSSQSSGGETHCRIFSIKPLYFDPGQCKWLVDENHNPMDLDPEGLDFEFSVGDRLAAYWDPQRAAWIPLVSGTATSTTTTPSSCPGTCKWKWDATTEEWVLISNNCSSAVTTTTTSIEGTTTSTTTLEGSSTTTSTSTTNGDCNCLYPTSCGEEGGEERTTNCSLTANEAPTCQECTGQCGWAWDGLNFTWILTSEDQCSEGCECEKPQLCGTSGICEFTQTNCSANASPPTPHCGQSTTTTSTTTSTTTTPAGCSVGCKWYFSEFYGAWTKLSDGCLDSCPCLPPALPGVDCEIKVQPCQVTTTTVEPLIPCVGICFWSWNDVDNRWVKIQDFCNDETASSRFQPCRCFPPSFDGECGSFAQTICSYPLNSTTTVTGTTNPPTTTTPEPGVCTHRRCTWRWNGSSWSVAYSNCIKEQCPCEAEPPYDGMFVGECAQVECGSLPTTTTTTTTTTSTTTTTTTTLTCACDEGGDPPEGTTFQCLLECQGGVWTFVDGATGIDGPSPENCNGGCGASCLCGYGDAGGAAEGKPCSPNGASFSSECLPTTTTTTGDPSTTTSSTTTTTTTCGPQPRCAESPVDTGDETSCWLECVEGVFVHAQSGEPRCPCPSACPCETSAGQEGDPCRIGESILIGGICSGTTTTTTTTESPTTDPPPSTTTDTTTTGGP